MTFTYSVAPMLDLTDSGFRRLIRLISKSPALYTEMVVDQALIHGDAKRFLSFDPVEHPICLQLAGKEPDLLAQAVRQTHPYPYDAINLNAGCPSVKVQAGTFGAVLMKDPARLSDCLTALKENSGGKDITVKTRIGFPDWTYDTFLRFVAAVSEKSGVFKWIIHARFADLSRRRTKDNIQKQDLHYDFVYRLKQDMPHLHVTLNGGIRSLAEADTHKPFVDSVMIGRAAYADPMLFAPTLDRFAVLKAALHSDIQRRHLSGIFHGQPKARLIRSLLSDKMLSNDAVIQKVSEL